MTSTNKSKPVDLTELLGEVNESDLPEELKKNLEAIRAERDQLKQQLTELTPKAPGELEEGDKIVLHFLEDGFVASGRTWYRGQELSYTVGEEAYEQQKDRNGNSWLDLIDNKRGQIERFGKHYFARGPWQGQEWGDISGLSDEERADAAQAAKQEKSRTIQAPSLPTVE